MKKPTKAQLKAAKAAVDLEEVIDAERSRREFEREERAALERQSQREALKAKSRVMAQEAGEAIADGAKSLVGEVKFVLAGLAIAVLIGVLVTLTPILAFAGDLWSSAIAFLNTTLPFLNAQALCFSAQMVKPYASSCVPVSWSAVVLFFALIVGANFAIDYTPKVIARIKGSRRRN